MTAREPWFEDLRSRKSQDFDGEAHLTNEELDALLAIAEAARVVEDEAAHDELTERSRARLYNALLVFRPEAGNSQSETQE